MRRLAIHIFLAGCLLAPVAVQAQSNPQPWVQATEELKATETDLAASGLLAINKHRDRLEKALTEGSSAFPPPPAADGTQTVLADGMAESLVAMAATKSSNGKTVAVFNPYPRIALFLGSYYTETGKPEDALRVLAAGMKLNAAPSLALGETLPLLYGEQAAAYVKLRRWTDSLAACETGLKITTMQDRDRARLHRSRGFALIELERLDDAQAAYAASLKLEPDNAIAVHEMEYIAKLRRGGMPGAPVVILPPVTPEPGKADPTPTKPL